MINYEYFEKELAKREDKIEKAYSLLNYICEKYKINFEVEKQEMEQDND